jgi:SNF2 family DNA or RNA helicase
LTGADTVIHYDPWWNVAAENQATDRAYRIGQNKNVEVIKLIMQDSVEQRVIELQNKKKDLIDKLISDDDSSITKVSVDDLKFILK